MTLRYLGNKNFLKLEFLKTDGQDICATKGGFEIIKNETRRKKTKLNDSVLFYILFIFYVNFVDSFLWSVHV